MNTPSLLLAAITLAAFASSASALEPFKYDNNPDGVQVFILAGQSNMVGYGRAEDGHANVKGAIGSLRHLAVNDTAKYGHLLEDPANPAASPWKSLYHVKVWWRDSELDQPRAVLKGDLNVGYSQKRNPGSFGPEYGFGWVMGKQFPDKPVLLIKVAWGGKSLNTEFRPPSAVAARGGKIGPYYTALIQYVRDCLANLDTEFPEFAGMGYTIRGFGWHQGWNDRVSQANNEQYEANMKDFIADIRAEFNNATLPFVIATTGMGGWNEKHPRALSLMNAQLAMQDFAKFPAHKGNVAVVETRDFWREADASPASQNYHWNQNAESYFLIGTAMGNQMAEILKP